MVNGLSVGAIQVVDKEASVGLGGPKLPNTVFAGYGTGNKKRPGFLDLQDESTVTINGLVTSALHLAHISFISNSGIHCKSSATITPRLQQP